VNKDVGSQLHCCSNCKACTALFYCLLYMLHQQAAVAAACTTVTFVKPTCAGPALLLQLRPPAATSGANDSLTSLPRCCTCCCLSSSQQSRQPVPTSTARVLAGSARRAHTPLASTPLQLARPARLAKPQPLPVQHLQQHAQRSPVLCLTLSRVTSAAAAAAAPAPAPAQLATCRSLSLS
jgi:hypothetical protein